MGVHWFYRSGEQQVGPLTESQIMQLYQSGEITDDHCVWTDGMANWVLASQVRDRILASSASGGGVANAFGNFESRDRPVPPEKRTEGIGRDAEFWLRFAAALIDTVLLLVIASAVGCVVVVLLRKMDDDDFTIISIVSNVLSVVIATIIPSVFESSSWQATPGKKVFRLHVTDLYGQRVSFLRAAARNLGKYVSAFYLMIGYVMAGVTQQKQALHDILAGCLVVRD